MFEKLHIFRPNRVNGWKSSFLTSVTVVAISYFQTKDLEMIFHSKSKYGNYSVLTRVEWYLQNIFV